MTPPETGGVSVCVKSLTLLKKQCILLKVEQEDWKYARDNLFELFKNKRIKRKYEIYTVGAVENASFGGKIMYFYGYDCNRRFMQCENMVKVWRK